MRLASTSSQRSKSVNEFVGQDFDYVITVCDNANENCPIFSGKTERVHQSFEDPPPPATGDEEHRMAIFRRVRDEIRAWLGAEFIPRAFSASSDARGAKR
ncbi:MAG: hypothetical protein WKF84_00780 [Pyrinomonadaceae bacterium]